MHEFSGLEFDWLACDADGFVGMFASAGFGAVPEESVAIPDAVDAALDRFKALPAKGDATSIGGTTTPDDWMAAARRGLFAFDWAHNRDRYEIEARPSRALHIDAIPDDATRDLVKRVQIPVRFSQLRWVVWDEAGNVSSGAED